MPVGDEAALAEFEPAFADGVAEDESTARSMATDLLNQRELHGVMGKTRVTWSPGFQVRSMRAKVAGDGAGWAWPCSQRGWRRGRPR